jgi:putative transposase
VIYGFVEAEKANHSIGTLCRALRVSKSGYYSWRSRPPSARFKADAVLTERIERIHRDSRGTYGARRVHAELRASGIRCGKKRVARLMRKAALEGCGGRRRVCTTRRRYTLKRAIAAPDLVMRNFTPEGPNRLWVADITYARSWEGWLYVAFVLNAFSGKVVGWSMANHLRTELVLDALNNMAIHNRRPAPGP